jgi:hypothetical protein
MFPAHSRPHRLLALRRRPAARSARSLPGVLLPSVLPLCPQCKGMDLRAQRAAAGPVRKARSETEQHLAHGAGHGRRLLGLQVMTEVGTGRSRGYGFVRFNSEVSWVSAGWQSASASAGWASTAGCCCRHGNEGHGAASTSRRSAVPALHGCKRRRVSLRAQECFCPTAGGAGPRSNRDAGPPPLGAPKPLPCTLDATSHTHLKRLPSALRHAGRVHLVAASARVASHSPPHRRRAGTLGRPAPAPRARGGAHA